jgi:hypothetical protein
MMRITNKNTYPPSQKEWRFEIILSRTFSILIKVIQKYIIKDLVMNLVMFILYNKYYFFSIILVKFKIIRLGIILEKLFFLTERVVQFFRNKKLCIT